MTATALIIEVTKVHPSIKIGVRRDKTRSYITYISYPEHNIDEQFGTKEQANARAILWKLYKEANNGL